MWLPLLYEEALKCCNVTSQTVCPDCPHQLPFEGQTISMPCAAVHPRRQYLFVYELGKISKLLFLSFSNGIKNLLTLSDQYWKQYLILPNSCSKTFSPQESTQFIPWWQAYKIHGTVGPPVPEKNWPPQKIFKTEKKKKKNHLRKKWKC